MIIVFFTFFFPFIQQEIRPTSSVQGLNGRSMVTHSSCFLSINFPLSVSNTSSGEALPRMLNKADAVAMVACPHIFTSLVGVNQRRPNLLAEIVENAKEILHVVEDFI